MLKHVFILISAFLTGIGCINGQVPDCPARVQYLFIVTTDGMRWQEVFNGADSALLFDKTFTPETEWYSRLYWAPEPAARRQKLMPFLWSVFAAQGNLYGNRQYGNMVNVSNAARLSYPGYNELFTGDTDDERINSNRKIANPNTNVLEFLHHQPALRERVAAFASWDVFPYILHEKRAGFPVNAAFENVDLASSTAELRTLNALQHVQPKYWDDGVRLDFMTFAIARAYIEARHPSVTFIGLDETDEYAHAGRYGQYLDAAHQVDCHLAKLWDFIQRDSVYCGKSALLVTVDHGRGDKIKKQWCDHGPRVEGADQIWFGLISPGIQAGGERKEPIQIWQKQLASTMAGLLGYSFQCDHPVAESLEGLLNSPDKIVVSLRAADTSAQ